MKPLPLTALLRGTADALMDHRQDPPLHPLVVAPWRALCKAAAEAGFELAAASGYRSFARQCAIWNAKAEGRRPLHDAQGHSLQALALPPRERLHALLRYSALPGTSRHHWGTELDVYDRKALTPGQTIQLEPWEVSEGGPFGPLHRWLDERIAEGRSFGFFRPYEHDCGGVAPERWHLSYAPLAAPLQRLASPSGLEAQLRAAGVALVEEIAKELPALWQRYVEVSAASYPRPWQG